MNGPPAAANYTLQLKPKEKRAIRHLHTHAVPNASNGDVAAHAPRYLFRAWREIVARIRNAEICALLLDFDGTLVKLQRNPWEVRVPQRTKHMLERLARNPRLFVAIVSGRRCRDLQTRIGVETLHFIGLHGAEEQGKTWKISNAVARILARARRGAHTRISAMRGMRTKEKGTSFAFHYRGASEPVARSAKSCLLDVVAPLRDTLR